MRRISENMSQEDREELWGSLVDVVEDWLAEKGFTPEDFPSADREGAEDEAIIFGDDYDILADGFAEVIGISRDKVDGGEDFADLEERYIITEYEQSYIC